MKLVLGTVQFGLDYGINSAGRPTPQTVVDILALAACRGINMLDTSAAYGDSEKILGIAIPSTDSRFRIISKYPKKPNSVRKTLEGTLADLGAKSIYGYLLHHFDVYHENPQIWSEFERVRESGLVEKIGFSLYSPGELDEIFRRGTQFDLVQFPYNIFDRRFEPYMPELKSRGVEIHVRSTFLQGLFFKDRDTLPEKLRPLRKYLKEIDDYAKANKLSIAQVALNFSLQNDYIDGVLIGVDNVEQLRDNISAMTDKQIEISMNVLEQELLSPVNWQ